MLTYFFQSTFLALLLSPVLNVFSPDYPLLAPAENVDKKEFLINYSSSLYLEGSTNVNSFTCSVAEYQSQKNIEVFQTSSNCCNLRFRHLALMVSVPKLDCGKNGINRDLQKTLKADEYPYIQIQILSAEVNEDTTRMKTQEGMTAEALAEVTIANTTQKATLHLIVRKTGTNKYSFSGKVPLKMTQFGLEPPTVLLGLVSVKDQIYVSLEMDITLME